LNLRRGAELRNERERNQPGKKIDKIDRVEVKKEKRKG